MVGLVLIFHGTDQATVAKIGAQNGHSWNSPELIKSQEEDKGDTVILGAAGETGTAVPCC